MKASIYLAGLISMSLLAGCDRKPDEQAQPSSVKPAPETQQQPLETLSEQQASNPPIEQDYRYEGYEEASTEPVSDQPLHEPTEQEQLEVSRHLEPSKYTLSGETSYIVIAALSDDVSINNVTLNRGNCNVDQMGRKGYLQMGRNSGAT